MSLNLSNLLLAFSQIFELLEERSVFHRPLSTASHTHTHTKTSMFHHNVQLFTNLLYIAVVSVQQKRISQSTYRKSYLCPIIHDRPDIKGSW